MSWYIRFKKMKAFLDYSNEDVAVITGNTSDSVKSVTSPSYGNFPRWAKLAIVVFETMLVKIKKLEITKDYNEKMEELTTEKDG